MNKKDFFILAMKAGNYRYIDWVVSAFCLTKEEGKSSSKYQYRIISDPSGYFFKDENGETVRIDDAAVGEPIFKFKEKISLIAGDLPNLSEDIESTYGNAIANWVLLVEAFGSKLNYLQGRIKIDNIEEKILERLKDEPQPGEIKDQKSIYISEYLKFADACFYLTGFTQICVWALTEKIMIPPDGLKEFKAKLFEEYKGKLDDPATIAAIDAKLVAFDKTWRGDDPGNNFLFGKKSVNIVRKKKFLMHGGEANVGGNANKMTLIQNSLYEGWDLKAFPAMNNSSRMGSFSRGAETMLGGVEVKWMLRASTNINVTDDDCGSELGMIVDVNKDNISRIVGFKLAGKDKTFIETKDQAGAYLGKRVMVRSPMYCKLTRTDFCKTCVGSRLSSTPFGLSSAVSSYGSDFLSLFLGAMHGKVLEVQKMDYKEALF